MADIPIIDIGPLVGRSAGVVDIAGAIGKACRETGFFYVVGHGIAPALVDAVFAMSREFFGQPLAAKQRAAFSGPSGNRGWIKLGNEALDPGKPHDLKEAFNIGLELPANPRKMGPLSFPMSAQLPEINARPGSVTTKLVPDNGPATHCNVKTGRPEMSSAGGLPFPALAMPMFSGALTEWSPTSGVS